MTANDACGRFLARAVGMEDGFSMLCESITMMPEERNMIRKEC